MTTAGVLDFPGVAFLAGARAFGYVGDGSIGVLPAGAVVYDVMVVVTEAFNAGTTNKLWLGTAASPLLFLEVDAGPVLRPGVYRGIEKAGVGVVVPPGSLRLYFRYDQTGTAATTGAAVVYVLYLPSMR